MKQGILGLSLCLLALVVFSAKVPVASAQFDGLGNDPFSVDEAPKVLASAVVREGNPPQLEITAEIEPGW